ncbi:MAG: alanine racemase [Lachnospiraceae bacterium]|nr:alanine racemase [Lachnospiraceae bacterium]
MKIQFDRVYAGVNLDHVGENIDSIASNLLPDTKIIAVIKTDAYGHGALPIAKELEQKDVVLGYGVATAEEALQLKNNGIRKPIIIIGYSFPSAYEEMIVRDVRLTVFTPDMLKEINSIAKRLGLIAKVHIKVDTGMSRIGIYPDDEGLDFVREALGYTNIRVEGVFTHLARADEEDKKYALRQLNRFHGFVDRVREELGFNFDIVHCLNSAGIIELNEYCDTCVRAGIIMYGMWPSDEVRRDVISLKPLLSLKSHITFIKKVPAGVQISYGGTYETDSETLVATVPVGYGDGYPRSLSNKGKVLVRGRRVPIIGRVCMDQFMIDVSDVPGVCIFDEVTLIGSDGEECITMEELQHWSGMLNYELACLIGKRVPRVYTKNGEIKYTRDFFNDARLVQND